MHIKTANKYILIKKANVEIRIRPPFIFAIQNLVETKQCN